MKISHSKTELYNLCPAKYRFKYIDKLEVNKTFTPLLFGGAIDVAINYLLLRTKHGHCVYLDTAISIFLKKMIKWQGQNELIYFKNECPDIDPYSGKDFNKISDAEKQWAVWEHLCNIGKSILQTYKEEILPQFKEIVSVQTHKEIPNQEGDVLVLITDFTARLHDGRLVVFDNKTTSDIKKSYPKTSVSKSQQLAIYAEFEETSLAGYIALQKKLKKDKVVWDMIIDEVPESQIQKAFEKIDDALRSIKVKDFTPNKKACWSFGRKCEFFNACHFGNYDDIIKK